MKQQASPVLAAIDIGSNTIEVLIARCSPDNVESIEHQSTMVRLGESVNDKGEISRDEFKTALRLSECSHQSDQPLRLSPVFDL